MKEKLKVNPILSAILAFFVIHLFIFVIMIILSFIAFFVLRHELNPDLFTYHLLVIDYIFSASIFSLFYPIGWLVVYWFVINRVHKKQNLIFSIYSTLFAVFLSYGLTNHEGFLDPVGFGLYYCIAFALAPTFYHDIKKYITKKVRPDDNSVEEVE